MSLSDTIAAVLETFQLSTIFFGESVTATPPSGDPVSLVGDVGPETTRHDTRGGKKLVIRSRTMTFSVDASLDCGGIAASEPLIDYKMTYGGREYSVAEVLEVSEAGKFARVRLEHVTEAEGPRPGLRDGGRW